MLDRFEEAAKAVMRITAALSLIVIFGSIAVGAASLAARAIF